MARRTTEGKTGREIKRCLSRYIARDLFRPLENGPEKARRTIGASRVLNGLDEPRRAVHAAVCLT